MHSLTLNLPVLYGDHHVIEVRRILQALPGVVDVYASSCFQLVQISYDPTRIDPDVLQAKLEEAGYLQNLNLPAESGTAVSAGNESGAYFRHTAAYEPTGHTISFARSVPDSGRPLWPCPGIGVIQRMEEGDKNA
jgi:Heavy-metal-associated domain